MFRAHVCSSAEVISHCPSLSSASALRELSKSSTWRQQEPACFPGCLQRMLPARICWKSRGPRSTHPRISSSLAPRLQLWHFSSFQHLAPLIPRPRGEPGTRCVGTRSTCRSAAGIWRRGRLREEGTLEPKPSATPLATIRGRRLVPQSYVWIWTVHSLAAAYPVSGD